ncbi:MAG: hypothetical protein LWY06_00915 [Firmicutes bacterium]|nr:hypothetical protein [Bacillota bacterium]
MKKKKKNNGDIDDGIVDTILAMLETGPLSPVEISQMLDQPLDEVLPIMETFVRHGMVYEAPDRIDNVYYLNLEEEKDL